MCPYLLPDWNATCTRQLATVFYAPAVQCALWPRIGSRDTAENKLRYKSKKPLLIDQLERHLHRRCPQHSAPQLSCLSSGRALDAEIQPKNKLRYKSKGPLLIDQLQRHLHRKWKRHSAQHISSLSSAAYRKPKYRRKTNYATGVKYSYLLTE
jgi:hypothetical protein